MARPNGEAAGRDLDKWSASKAIAEARVSRTGSCRSVHFLLACTSLQPALGGGPELFLSVQHRPDHPRILVGDRDYRPVRAATLFHGIDPCAEAVGLVLGSPDDGAGAMDQERAQVLIAALADAHQDASVAARVLSRHESQPGSEMTAVFEVASGADRRDNRGRGLRADATDPRQALAVPVLPEYAIDPAVERHDPGIEFMEEREQAAEDLAA